MQIRIDAKNISKKYGTTKVLQNISLSIFPGECIGLLGPSGAGKSTLLKILNGFYDPSGGEVLYNGKKLEKNFDDFRSQIGYVPQDDIVHESLSVEKVLHYASLLRLPKDWEKSKIEKNIENVLNVLELTERKKLKVKKLSGGQRKRVNIGVELINSPPVLFLDEPTSGLDPALEEKMMTLFSKLAKEGRTVILTTHIMETVDLLDFLVLLLKGNLIYFAPPQYALDYFKVSSFSGIYKRINEATPPKWAERFRGSSLYQKFVIRRFDNPFKGETVEIPDQKPTQEKTQKKELSLEEELELMKKKLK